VTNSRRASFHEEFRREEDGKPPSERRFGLSVGILLLVVAAFLLWRERPIWAAGLLATGACLVALAVAAPRLLGPLNRGWARLGLVLHALVTPAVMALLFYLTVTPVGLVMRLLGKDFARLRMDHGAATYWIERRPPGPPPDSMRQQF
jgi:hypothetical protein